MLTTKFTKIQCAGGIRSVTKFIVYEQPNLKNGISEKNYQTKLIIRKPEPRLRNYSNTKKENTIKNSAKP